MDVEELIERAPGAFLLACVIAQRARFQAGESFDGREPGEAFLGDHDRYKMSEQQYRTAKCQLAKWNFATFRTTNKGTLAKLTDSRLFDIFSVSINDQVNVQATDKQRLTKNVKNDKNKEREERARFFPPDLDSVKLQCAKIGLSEFEGEKFWNYYEANGWKVGRNPMRNWVSALVNWKGRIFESESKKGAPLFQTSRKYEKPNPRNFGIDLTNQTELVAAKIKRDEGARLSKRTAGNELAKTVAPIGSHPSENSGVGNGD